MVRLEDDSTHFKCAGCSSICLVEDGHIAKVAYNVYDRDSQDHFCYTPHNVLLCTDCYECKGKEKLREKEENDGNNNSKSKRPPRR